jgi:hypothetical protein
VGDKNFQKKSRAKTEELLKSGKTVLFVSHSESLINEFCSRVVYLKDGAICYDGDVKRGLATYHADNLHLKREATISYIEAEVNENELRLRFEFGIGAEGNVIADDDINKYHLNVNLYDYNQKEIIEEAALEYRLDLVNDTFIDLYLNSVDLINDGYYNITFTYDGDDELREVHYLNKSDIIDLGDYELQLRNKENHLVFELLYDDKNSQKIEN